MISRLSRFLALSFIVISTLTNAIADDVVDPSKPNVISIEVLGRGVAYSIDYDRMLSDYVALGGGLSFYSVTYFGQGDNYFLIPLYADFYLSPLIGRGFFTAGVTASISNGTKSGTGPFVGSGLAATVGGGYEYRYQSSIFRAAGYFLIGNVFQPWVGLNVGLIF